MCGRYRLSRKKQILEEHFGAEWSGDDWVHRYNIAPTQPVPVLRQSPKEAVRVLSLMRWGLIPSWSKDAASAAKMINARSETASTLPAFSNPLRFRRCLVPADAFYEWKRSGRFKQPFSFEVSTGEPFAFAGLWDRWKDATGKTIESCAILTTRPNAVTSVLHDRMPVILNPGDYDVWLDPGMQSAAAVSDLLTPFDANLMQSHPVSTRVNSVANDDEECSRPLELSEVQAALFS